MNKLEELQIIREGLALLLDIYNNTYDDIQFDPEDVANVKIKIERKLRKRGIIYD